MGHPRDEIIPGKIAVYYTIAKHAQQKDAASQISITAIFPASWKKQAAMGIEGFISEFTIPLQSIMISVVRVAYKIESLKFAWRGKSPAYRNQ